MKAKKRVYEEPEAGKYRKGKSQTAKRRARKVAAEEDEERRLTALLFGGGGDAAPLDAMLKVEAEEEEEPSGTLEFEIDRTGAVEYGDHDEADGKDDERALVAAAGLPSKASHAVESDHENDDEQNEGDRPAWVDEDDEKIEVDLFQTSRLRKLRKTRNEPEAAALKGSDFAERLRERYKSTMQRTARTDWAHVDAEVEDDDDDDRKEDESDTALDMSLDGPLLRQSSRRLPPNLLNVVRCPDANQNDPNNAVVQCVHFHPGSEPERPLMLTAGLDKTLRFFHVDDKESVKVHGIHCKSTNARH